MNGKVGRGLREFIKAHDPIHKLTPDATLSRPLPAGTRRFIVTAAQNATPVHEDWWAILERVARETGAELLVIPIRYKNPTSQWVGSQQNAEWWAGPVRPYLWNARRSLNSNLTLLADFKVQPTASSPLTGAEGVSHASSGIIGHTKLQMRSIATPSSRMAKVMTTTGACTVANYTDSRAGKMGEFHHSLSAIMVELDGKRFHLRQLHYDKKTRSCTDLDRRYTAGGVEQAPRALAVIMGDTHVDSVCALVERATFGKGGILETVNPEHLVWHDTLDSYSCTPHHEGNPFNAFAKRAAGADDVRAEVERAIDFIREHTPKGVLSVVVGSNHDDMLRRWVIRNDWRSDPTNAEFYLETALAMVRGTTLTRRGTQFPDPFAYWLRQKQFDNIKVLDGDESFSLADIELGMHGDRGPNGSRGSIKNLRRIGVKSIIGHSHSPGIDEGCYQVGTSTLLRLEYNHGASSWLNAHCVLNADGKRQIIVIVDGKWRI